MSPVNDDRYTEERLLELTSTTPERLRSLERLEILFRAEDGTYGPDAVERLTLLKYAESCGITDEQVEHFCRDHGDLLASLLSARPTRSRALTVDEMLSRLPPGVLDQDFINELMAVVGPDPGEPVTEEDVAALQMATEALTLGFPAEALLQMIRVFADALDRVAEAENRVFHDYVHEQHRVQGLVGQELFEATDALSQPMLAMAEPALLYLHRRAMTRAMREDFVRHLTEDSREPVRRPGEAPATVVFIDLAGFTPMTLTMGDTAAAEVLSRFAMIVRSAAAEWHGRIVKQIGDAFMLVFDAPGPAVQFGVSVCAAVAAESRFPPVHIGAHHGSVLYRDADYVGNTVNLAARVASASATGQFLVTAAIAEAARDIRDVQYKELPPTSLKGIDTPTSLFEVRHALPTPVSAIDPVCGMNIRPGDQHSTEWVDGERLVFCSETCHVQFRADPDKYRGRRTVQPSESRS